MMELLVRLGPWVVVIFILASFILPQAIRVLREYERGVIFRLGRFSAVKGPGLYWIIPFIDAKQQVDIRTNTVDIESQETVTKDSVTIRVNAVNGALRRPARARRKAHGSLLRA